MPNHSARSGGAAGHFGPAKNLWSAQRISGVARQTDRRSAALKN